MLKLAWRNLWRNRARTLIVGSAIVFSYALMLISLGINEDVHGKMMDAAAVGAGGQVLVHGDGWWEAQSGDIVIEKPGQVEQVLEQVDGVDTVIPRVVINGLATSSRGNEAVRLMGVDLEREEKLRDLREHLHSGDFFSGEYDSPVVMSRKLVDKLGLERGDKVVLTASTPAGEVTRALFRLDGSITSSAVGEMLAYTTIPAAQQAVNMEGQLTQFGLLSADGVSHGIVDERVSSALKGRDLEVLSWEEAVPEMVGFIQMDDAFGYLYMIVVFIVVVFAIANTFLMAVMERVREFGLLNAIGMTPARVGRLIFWETGLLATISILLGFALALTFHFYVLETGIDLSTMTGADMELAGVSLADMIMRSRIDPLQWSVATITVFVAVMLSASYPAWRASTLGPAEAMRFYE